MEMEDLYKLKKGDKVLVECTVEAVFVQSGMVMVKTRDCDDGFDAYVDEIKGVVMNSIIGFLLFLLGIIFGAIIVFIAIYPIIKDMFNYIQDMNKIFKDKENKTNGEN